MQQLKVTIQKARNGMDYLQIMSDDQFTVNIVLLADKIVVEDDR